MYNVALYLSNSKPTLRIIFVFVQFNLFLQIYSCITSIILHVIYNLFAHILPPMLSEKAVYSELELC